MRCICRGEGGERTDGENFYYNNDCLCSAQASELSPHSLWPPCSGNYTPGMVTEKDSELESFRLLKKQMIKKCSLFTKLFFIFFFRNGLIHFFFSCRLYFHKCR